MLGEYPLKRSPIFIENRGGLCLLSTKIKVNVHGAKIYQKNPDLNYQIFGLDPFLP
jgi:hypothetical protein